VPPPPPTPTNEALLAAIERGDGTALHELYRRHADLIRGVIARFIDDENECEDVLREVFEAIRDRAEHYTRDKGYVLGWMITLARRSAMKREAFLHAQDAAVATESQTDTWRNEQAHSAGQKYLSIPSFFPSAA
jgi:RNA polymerase sigma-70 factor (ECF subfamily)